MYFDDGGGDPSRIKAVPAPPTLVLYVDAAQHLADAGAELTEARSALTSEKPDLVKTIDGLLSQLQVLALDLTLAAEPHDPTDAIGKVFAASVYA